MRIALAGTWGLSWGREIRTLYVELIRFVPIPNWSFPSSPDEIRTHIHPLRLGGLEHLTVTGPYLIDALARIELAYNGVAIRRLTGQPQRGEPPESRTQYPHFIRVLAEPSASRLVPQENYDISARYLKDSCSSSELLGCTHRGKDSNLDSEIQSLASCL